MSNEIRPKLVVTPAAAALRWYVEVLEAAPGPVFENGDTVVFAELSVRGTTLTLKDADDHDPVASPGPILDVVAQDPDSLARRMVEAGADQVLEMSDRPWGGRWGRVRDPYGVQWILQSPETSTPDQIRAAMRGEG